MFTLVDNKKGQGGPGTGIRVHYKYINISVVFVLQSETIKRGKCDAKICTKE